ncbi:MAG: AI-2E family transporter [Gammaproteobacteria bacterium]|nr:AI-2E family transporter [Gammaproteobacteria bacterium]
MSNILSTWFKRYLSQPEAIAILVICTMTIIVFKTMGQVLVPIIVGVVLAYLLFGIVKQLERLRCPHLLAVIIAFSLFMSLLWLAFFWLLPLLWNEAVELVTDVPQMLNHGQESVLKLHDMFPELISVSQLQQIMVHVNNYLANFGKEVVKFSLASLFGVVTLVVYLVLVPLLVFFFLRDGKEIIKWLVGFLPKKRLVLKGVWEEMHGKIRSYIQGKSIEIIIVSIVTIIAFGFLGLRYAILLGALVGLSVVIPYIGVIVVTVPIVVVGAVQWGWSSHFFYLMLIYSLISILDANILVPILFSGIMNLHPLAIILAVLIFGNLFGFWGVFFAIPLMTLVKVVVKSWPKEEYADS